MSYSRYFGMRGFENIVRDGRFRVPSTGTPFKIGTPVEIDPANPGRLKLAGDTAVPGANCGVVVFEHIQNKSDALTTQYDSPYDEVPLGQYAQMVHGPGAKVWFKNVAAKTLYDGRQQAGGTLLAAGLDLATLQVGTGLNPTADGKFEAAAVAPNNAVWLVVEQVNPAAGLVEARFNF
jgi:hypothetical protein